jgi:hypothetical protein
MGARTFHFRLHSHPSGNEPAAASLQLERLNESGTWEALIPSLATPGFRLYLSAMLICLHYHLVAEARERGVRLARVEGRFSASTKADWALTELRGDFLLQPEPDAEPMDSAEAPAGQAQGESQLIAALQERMLHCPVFRNLDPAIPRALHLEMAHGG